jgi:hypothetical protein
MGLLGPDAVGAFRPWCAPCSRRHPPRRGLTFRQQPAHCGRRTSLCSGIEKPRPPGGDDLFMTPTAERADYVLPAAYWPEMDQVLGTIPRRQRRLLPAKGARSAGLPDGRMGAR